MGSFLNTPHDQQILTALNNRFSDALDRNPDPDNPNKTPTMLDSVRFQDQKEAGLLFSRHLNLARLAFRLNAYPTDQKARLRWYFLLRRLLPHATKVAISAVLEAVMGDATIKQVHFDLTHDSTITTEFELDPNNAKAPHTTPFQSTANPAVQVNTCMMLLRCYYDEPLPDPDPNYEPDPPNPHNPEQPPMVIK
jgi:hypothetical protein